MVLYDPLIKKTRQKKRLAAYRTSFLPLNRERAISDLVLEIEYTFIHELNKYVPCFFHRHDIIAPALCVYPVCNLEEISNNKEIMSVLNFYNNDYDKSKDGNYIFNLGYSKNWANTNSCLVNTTSIEKLEYNDGYFDSYFCQLAEYYVFDTLKPVIEKKIIDNQRKLNKLVANSSSARKLLKAKLKALMELNIYKRLVSAKLNYEFVPFENHYFQEFENSTIASRNEKYLNLLYCEMDNLRAQYNEFNNQIQSLYQFYDENLKTIESSTNIRLVRLTLIFTFITLLATIFTILVSLNLIPIHKNSDEETAETSVVTTYLPYNDI